MKTKLLAVMATLGMVASASAVKINNNLSINGFIDGSYNSSDNGVNDEANIGLDEVELNFIFNAGNVSGELHIDNNNERAYTSDFAETAGTASTPSANDGSGAPGVANTPSSSSADNRTQNDLDIEQVHFTYSFGNGTSVTVGRFNSALGLEREDPAGLYTFSRAYSAAFNLGDIDTNGAQEGIRLSYSAGDLSGSFALYDAIGSSLETGGVKDDLDYELALNYTGLDNITVGAGFQSDRAAGAGNDSEVYTINATYTLNKLLLAAEYVNTEIDGNAFDTAAYMVLADYDVNDKLGVAVRYSNWETGAATDSDKLTFAPNYAITDSLGAIIEFSAEETSAGAETDSFAVELTYTF